MENYTEPTQAQMLQDVEAARQATQAVHTHATNSGRAVGQEEYMQAGSDTGPAIYVQTKGLSSKTEASTTVAGPNTTTKYNSSVVEGKNFTHRNVTTWLGRASIKRFNEDGDEVYSHDFTNLDAARRLTSLIAKQTARRAQDLTTRQDKKAA